MVPEKWKPAHRRGRPGSDHGGLVDVKAGEVIYISGAAGAVVSVAGQLAK